MVNYLPSHCWWPYVRLHPGVSHVVYQIHKALVGHILFLGAEGVGNVGVWEEGQSQQFLYEDIHARPILIRGSQSQVAHLPQDGLSRER